MIELFKKYQKLFKLQDWEIELIEEPTMDEIAHNFILYNDYKCVIRIRADLAPEEKEKALIHELLHMIFRDAHDLFTENCDNEAIKLYCQRQHERTIEKTAKIIYSLVKQEAKNHD